MWILPFHLTWSVGYRANVCKRNSSSNGNHFQTKNYFRKSITTACLFVELLLLHFYIILYFYFARLLEPKKNIIRCKSEIYSSSFILNETLHVRLPDYKRNSLIYDTSVFQDRLKFLFVKQLQDIPHLKTSQLRGMNFQVLRGVSVATGGTDVVSAWWCFWS